MATTKTEAFLERLMASDIGRRILAEAKAEEVDAEERTAKAGHLAALREGRAAFMEIVQVELRAAESEIKTARENLKAATANYNATLSTTFGKQWRYDQDIRDAEAYLARTAPARLKTALQSAQERLERLRSARVERTVFPDIPEAVGMTESDRPTIDAVHERVRDLADIEREIEGIKAEMLGGQL
ncbi:MAG TPA: hypothetical protein PK983_08385 [Syntrophales bacterium]|nr:hypothetical protein [Syntrophales bacterium]